MEELKKLWLLEAYRMALHSPDPSTQNGAIIVSESWVLSKELDLDLMLGRACNTFPKGVENKPERLERPLKYAMVEHAERGAIYDAALNGHCTKGATMFVPWFACQDCSRAIICSGIKNVIGHKLMMDKTPPHWKESIETAFIMFKEAGIQFELIDGTLNGPEILFNGETWIP